MKRNFKKLFNKIFTKKIFIPIFIFSSIFLFLTQAEFFVRSDGFYYYHTAKSIIDKGSFVTSTEPEYWDTAAPWARTMYLDKYISVASPGTALLNVPVLFVSKTLDPYIDLDDEYFVEYNGATLLEGILLVINAYIFFVLGLVLIYKILRKLGFSERNSLVSISISILSSYILWYVFIFPIFTHVFEFFFVALVLYIFLKFKESSNRKYLILLGAASAFLFLIRPIFLVIFPILWLLTLSRKSFKNSILNLIYLSLSTIPFLIIYFWYNYVSYGSFFASGYSVTGINFDFSSFNGLNVLFSIHRGWLVYSPIFIFSLVGLFLYLKKNRAISVISLWSIFAGVIVYGFWPSWWGGGSFGSRFLIYTLPFCIVGLAFFFSRLKDFKYKKLISLVVILFTLYSISLLFLYRVTGFRSEFYLPTDFFGIQLERITQSKSLEEYLALNLSNLQLGSSIPVILDGRMDYLLSFEKEGNILTLNLLKPEISKQDLPKYLDLYLVNKEDKKAYQLRVFGIKDGAKIDISCNQNCVEFKGDLNNDLELSKYSGIVLDNQLDLYIENDQSIQLRGEFVLWNNWNRYYRSF